MDERDGSGEPRGPRRSLTVVQAYEAFWAAHPGVTLDELLDWPFTRFNALFEAWQRRKAEEHILNRLDLETQAVLTNPNYDGKSEGGERIDKSKILHDLNQAAWNAIDKVYDIDHEAEEQHLVKTHPLFTAMRVPELPTIDTSTMGDAEQLRERDAMRDAAQKRPRPEIDQPLL